MNHILSLILVVTTCASFGTSTSRANIDIQKSSAFANTRPAAVELTLPAPTGSYAIGTVDVHLADLHRQDPYTATPHPRELMVSIWYPTHEKGSCAANSTAPWMQKAALDYFRADLEDILATPPQPPPAGPPPSGSAPAGTAPLEVSSDLVSLMRVDFPHTHAVSGASVERSPRRFPIVLYSPGFSFDREVGTALVEDLASHGYVVVTVSHTYDSSEVQFPGGRVELGKGFDGPNNPATPNVGVSIRMADIQFVIEYLNQIAKQSVAGIQVKDFPRGLGAALEVSRVGMFGHSLGGCTTATLMATLPQIAAGADLDGTIFPTVPFDGPGGAAESAASIARIGQAIGPRPFLFMASDVPNGPTSSPTAIGPGFWDNLTGWKRFVQIRGSTHLGFTDLPEFIVQLLHAGLIPPSDTANLPPLIGTIEPQRGIDLQRAYLRAFFDYALRGVPSQLLDGPSSQYPEAVFLN